MVIRGRANHNQGEVFTIVAGETGYSWLDIQGHQFGEMTAGYELKEC